MRLDRGGCKMSEDVSVLLDEACWVDGRMPYSEFANRISRVPVVHQRVIQRLRQEGWIEVEYDGHSAVIVRLKEA